MLASQKAYQLLSQTLLQCIDTTLHALWQPLSAQVRVPVSAPTLQAVVHSTVAVQWLGAWLSLSAAPTAIPIPEAPVSLSAHVEDLAQLAADVVATGAAANRVELFLAAPVQLGIDSATDAGHVQRFLIGEAPHDMSLPWFPSAYYGVATHTILVHVLSWLVHLSAQDSRVIVLPVTYANSSDARIDFFFDSTTPPDMTAWPSWLGPQADLQHVLDELGMMATQGLLRQEDLDALPLLAPLKGATNATYLRISLRRPRSIDLISSVPASVADGAPSLVRLVHGLPLEAMRTHLAHRRVLLLGSQRGGEALLPQIQSYLLELGCDAEYAPHTPPSKAPNKVEGVLSPERIKGGKSEGVITPDGSSAATSAEATPAEEIPSMLDAAGRSYDLVILHGNAPMLHALLSASITVPIVYFATPMQLERLAAEAFGANVVFLPEPVGHIRLMWALFTAWFTYDATTSTYLSRDGVVLPASARPPQGYSNTVSRSSSMMDSNVSTPGSTSSQEVLQRPGNSRESSSSSFTQLLTNDSNDELSIDQLHVSSPLSAPLPPRAETDESQSEPISPRTVVEDSMRTPVQRLQEPPDYFTKAVSQLATQPSNSGLVIRSADGRAAGIFFHPPTESEADGAPLANAPPSKPELERKYEGEAESSFDLVVPPRGPAVSSPLLGSDTAPSPGTELSLSNTTFCTEPVGAVLGRTDPVHGERVYPSGHVLQPVGFETILGIDPKDVPGGPMAVVPPAESLDISRTLAMERPPSMERPGAPKSIQLPPPPPIPSQKKSEVVKGQPTPFSHLPPKLKRTSAQPQSGLLIGGSFSREEAPKEAASINTTPGRHSPTSTMRSQRRKMALRDDFLPPVKVLIVEDNVINQRILSTFLRKRQIKYDIAKDGREAIEKWSQGDFHLILMDIQLPVLDGIEATKEIRRLEHVARGSPTQENTTPSLPTLASRHSVIIVALTASVLNSDRVAALAAGCNDFLNKPVSLPWLQRKILEWGSMQYLLHAGRAAFEHPPSPSGAACSAGRSIDRALDEKAQQVAERLHLSPPLMARQSDV